MKGIILAGGKGTRLQPATFVMNKHMVPILNKPMITYPLETLKVLGCTDIMIVSGGNHIGGIAEFLGDGSMYGVALTYRVQKDAGGIAQALGLAEGFAQGENVAVILGDNIFDNEGIKNDVHPWDAHLFVKEVRDPERFGVLAQTSDEDYFIIEKPKTNVGNKAVTGLYIYPSNVFDILPTLVPSAREELEITDVNNWFMKEKRMAVTTLKGFWSDAGTPESLFEVVEWAHNNSKHG